MFDGPGELNKNQQLTIAKDFSLLLFHLASIVRGMPLPESR